MKLKEANKERAFSAAVKYLYSWPQEVKVTLINGEIGKELDSVQNLMKKHSLIEIDIISHEDCIEDIYEQAGNMIESGQFDSEDIMEGFNNFLKNKIWWNFPWGLDESY